MVLGRALSWTAERYPERIAIGAAHPLTYAEWDARTNRLARGLGSLGVSRGDRVVLVSVNGEPMASTHFACQKLGAASVPLNVRYSPDELAYCLRDAEPKVVLSDDTTRAGVRSALAHWSAMIANKVEITGKATKDKVSVQLALARSAAEADAAELLLDRAARVADLGQVTPSHLVRNSRDYAVAMDLLVTSVERIFRAGGARGQTVDFDRPVDRP